MEEISNLDIVTESPDFSMLGLFMQADIVVKSVIIILILASIYSWSVIVSKILRMRQLKKLESEFDEIFWSGNSFEDLYETLNFNKTDPKSKIFCAAISEWKKSKLNYEGQTNSNIASLKETLTISFLRILLGLGLGLLVIEMLSLSGIMAGIVLLQSAMPSAVFNYVFADRFNRESDKVAAVILQSTLISALSLPLLVAWVISF